MAQGKIGEAWVDIQANMRPFNQAVAGLSSKLKAIGTKMQSVGRRATAGLTLPIAAAGGAAGKMALDFEEALTRMESLVGLTSSEVANFKQEIEDMSGEVGKSPQELAEAMFFITSAGLEGSTALETLRASAKASAAGLGEVKTVADAATSAMNAYGAENLSAESATSTMIAAVREGKLEASDLANSLGQVIPIASQLGISFNDVGAQMAAMSRLGLDARRAATAMRGIMRGLVKPSDQAKEQLQAVGLSVDQLRSKVEQGNVIGVMQDLKAAFAGNSEAMSNVFPRIRGLIGAMSLTGENAGKAQEIMDKLSNTTGDLDESFESISDKGFFKASQATSDFQNVLTKFGEAVKRVAIPILTRLTDFLLMAEEKFENLSETMQDKVIKGLLAIAGIGPALIAAGAAVAALGSLIGGLGTAMSAVVTIGPVLASVFGSLTAALTAMWDTNKTVMENLKNIWNGLKKAVQTVVSTMTARIKTFWGAIKPILVALGGLIKEVANQLVGGLIEGAQFDGVTKSFQNFRNVAVKVLNKLSEKITDAIEDVTEFLRETKLLKKMTKAFGFIASQAFQNFIETLSTTLGWINKIISAIDTAISKVNTLMNKLPDSISGALGGVSPITAIDDVMDFSADIVESGVNAAQEIIVPVNVEGKEVARATADATRSTL